MSRFVQTNWKQMGLIVALSMIGYTAFCQNTDPGDTILEDDALRSAVLNVLENEYGISGIELISDAMWERISTLDDFITWRSSLLERLESGSKIIETSLGTIEYGIQGSGPVILISHGGFTGYDMFSILGKLSIEGFTLLCPSRPGYLRTPLTETVTFEQEADMFAALLDSLNIHEKIVIYGASLGGPAALQFALRYPERVSAVILQDAVTTEYTAFSGEQSENLLVTELLMGETGFDQRSWIQRLICDRWPSTLFYQYIQTTNNFDADTNRSIAAQFMAIPSEREKLSELMDMFAPLSMRYPGTMQEMAQTANLPVYPVENIQVPFLYTQSTVDTDVEMHHAEFIQARLPNVNLYTFEGIGHFFWFGPEWDNTLTVMKNFLETNVTAGCYLPLR